MVSTLSAAREAADQFRCDFLLHFVLFFSSSVINSRHLARRPLLNLAIRVRVSDDIFSQVFFQLFLCFVYADVLSSIPAASNLILQIVSVVLLQLAYRQRKQVTTFILAWTLSTLLSADCPSSRL